MFVLGTSLWGCGSGFLDVSMCHQDDPSFFKLFFRHLDWLRVIFLVIFTRSRARLRLFLSNIEECGCLNGVASSLPSLNLQLLYSTTVDAFLSRNLIIFVCFILVLPGSGKSLSLSCCKFFDEWCMRPEHLSHTGSSHQIWMHLIQSFKQAFKLFNLSQWLVLHVPGFIYFIVHLRANPGYNSEVFTQ